jgi:hypothetical protein
MNDKMASKIVKGVLEEKPLTPEEFREVLPAVIAFNRVTHTAEFEQVTCLTGEKDLDELYIPSLIYLQRYGDVHHKELLSRMIVNFFKMLCREFRIKAALEGWS